MALLLQFDATFQSPMAGPSQLTFASITLPSSCSMPYADDRVTDRTWRDI